MNKLPYIFIYMMMSFGMFYGQSSPDDVKIGFLGNGLQDATISAVKKFLKDKDFDFVDVSSTGFNSPDIFKQGFTHIWVYQMDSEPLIKKKSISRSIKQYVREGGNLVLSMDAVSLLNALGIEKKTLEVKMDSIRDNGFGRPLGFHAFKSHPLFEGMHGGAYTWKAKKDHVVKKIGFFGSNLPSKEAKVIGTEWTYITFHEDNKLVLEYEFGKGKIIAVGAYTYFGKPNYNQDELHRFYENIFTYLQNPEGSSVSKYYWDYSPLIVSSLSGVAPQPKSKLAKEWELPQPSVKMSRKKASDAPTIMAGRRMMMIGSEKGGIEEIWTQPFMSFRDIRTAITFKDKEDKLWLDQLTPEISVAPEMIIRTYRWGSSWLKEVTTVSMEKPLGVLHYEWQGDDIKGLSLLYTTNFRYMWPYSHKVAGNLEYVWESNGNMAITTAQSGELTGILSFSSSPNQMLMGPYDGFGATENQIKGNRTDKHQVSGFFEFDAKQLDGTLDVHLYAGDQGLKQALSEYGSLREDFTSLLEETSNYYKNFSENKLGIFTPDSLFNQGYQWALMRTDQFFQETPKIGTSMVAGLGSTARGWDGAQEVSGRPGYSWYFGRDAQWCAFAVNGYGGQNDVKKILDVFEKYQALNGKILHELTTSGAVHYDASDATPLYVALAAHYLKYTGDVEYIRKKWKSLKKAMEFCYSTDTDGDGLIEITNVGHGWVEGGALFGTHTEIYLAGSWVAALESAAYIAKSLGGHDEAWLYQKDAERVKKRIDHSFWDKKNEYYYVGMEQDGTFRKEESVLTAVPIYFDAIIDSEKAKKSAIKYAGNDYSTDWGVRILPNTSKSYNPRSYHAGMVWPLFGGWASLAEYKTGYYNSAFSHIMNNLLVFDDWNLGSVEETLHGDHYDPAGVCSQQGWSQTMVLQPIYEGMLGMAPDVLANTLELAPRFPWNWDFADITNIPYGKEKVDMAMKRDKNKTEYHFETDSSLGTLLYFSPAFPLGTQIEEVKVNGEIIDYIQKQEAESIDVHFDFELTGSDEVTITHNGGIGALPKVTNPKPGSKNIGTKIIAQELMPDGTFHIILEGQPSAPFTVSLFSSKNIQHVNSGTVELRDGNTYTISGILPAEGKPYAKQTISIITN